MSRVYLIKPLEKKSIVYHVEMFRENEDGSISWFNIDETYRWGQGFIEEELDCNLPWAGDLVAYARADTGWGCEFDDSISVEWEFSDDIPPMEQQELKELYYEGGAGSLSSCCSIGGISSLNSNSVMIFLQWNNTNSKNFTTKAGQVGSMMVSMIGKKKMPQYISLHHTKLTYVKMMAQLLKKTLNYGQEKKQKRIMLVGRFQQTGLDFIKDIQNGYAKRIHGSSRLSYH